MIEIKYTLSEQPSIKDSLGGSLSLWFEDALKHSPTTGEGLIDRVAEVKILLAILLKREERFLK